MAAPRFSFSSGSTGFFNPNQILVPTQLSAADKAQAEKFQAEADAYDKLVEKYKADIDAYNAAVAKFNVSADNFNKGSSAPSSTTKMVCSGFSATGRGGGNVCTPVSNVSRGSPTPGVFTSGIGQAKPSSAPAPTFNLTVPVAPTQPSFSEEEVKAFSDAAKLRAQKQQAVKQTALNLFQNPTGFSQQYGIGSLGFADGGDVPQGGVAELNPYGIRYSGDTRNVISDSLKGKGYFGELTSPSGQAVTEYSLYDSDIGDYPSIVPTLTREEINDTVMRSSRQLPPSESVVMKARRHAMERIAEGKSPFAGRTELRFPVPSEADQDMVSRIQRFLEKNRP